jgi:nickel/cobalt transporter (NiCoT) family protein
VLNFLKTTVDDGSANQRTKIIAIYALLFAGNAVAWTWAALALSGRPAVLGTAFLAYVLGLRHAVDADHIAAIDNVVRKLMQEGKRPVSAGLFFSLGHSLVVTIAVAVIVGTAFALEGRLHPFKVIGSIIGTGASAFFLLAIAAINLVILRGVWKSFRRARRGEPVAEHELDMLLSGRGLLARIFRLAGSFWDTIGKMNDGLANFGYLVIGIFVVSWAVSYLIYRWQGFDRIPVERAEAAS